MEPVRPLDLLMVGLLVRILDLLQSGGGALGGNGQPGTARGADGWLPSGHAVSSPQAVFADPVAQLAALDPIAALAALSPVAALSFLSPTLRMFNPAINPRAALLAFNPAAAPALAMLGPPPVAAPLHIVSPLHLFPIPQPIPVPQFFPGAWRPPGVY